MRKVYVPNKAGHDYSGAANFGEVVFITEGTVNKFALDAFYRQAISCMKGAGPNDYLLITSLNSICSICAAILGRRFGRVNFLLFRAGRYVERSIYIDSLLSAEEIETKTREITSDHENN